MRFLERFPSNASSHVDETLSRPKEPPPFAPRNAMMANAPETSLAQANNLRDAAARAVPPARYSVFVKNTIRA